jgi:hypothetical protein
MACVKRSMAVSHSFAANALFPWAFNNCRAQPARAWLVAYPQNDGETTRTSAMVEGDGGEEDTQEVGITPQTQTAAYCAVAAFPRRSEESSRISWNSHRSRDALRWLQDGTRAFVLGINGIGVLSLCRLVDGLLAMRRLPVHGPCRCAESTFKRNFESLRRSLVLNKTLL